MPPKTLVPGGIGCSTTAAVPLPANAALPACGFCADSLCHGHGILYMGGSRADQISGPAGGPATAPVALRPTGRVTAGPRTPGTRPMPADQSRRARDCESEGSSRFRRYLKRATAGLANGTPRAREVRTQFRAISPPHGRVIRAPTGHGGRTRASRTAMPRNGIPGKNGIIRIEHYRVWQWQRVRY